MKAYKQVGLMFIFSVILPQSLLSNNNENCIAVVPVLKSEGSHDSLVMRVISEFETELTKIGFRTILEREKIDRLISQCHEEKVIQGVVGIDSACWQELRTNSRSETVFINADKNADNIACIMTQESFNGAKRTLDTAFIFNDVQTRKMVIREFALQASVPLNSQMLAISISPMDFSRQFSDSLRHILTYLHQKSFIHLFGEDSIAARVVYRLSVEKDSAKNIAEIIRQQFDPMGYSVEITGPTEGNLFINPRCMTIQIKGLSYKADIQMISKVLSPLGKFKGVTRIDEDVLSHDNQKYFIFYSNANTADIRDIVMQQLQSVKFDVQLDSSSALSAVFSVKLFNVMLQSRNYSINKDAVLSLINRVCKDAPIGLLSIEPNINGDAFSCHLSIGGVERSVVKERIEREAGINGYVITPSGEKNEQDIFLISRQKPPVYPIALWGLVAGASAGLSAIFYYYGSYEYKEFRNATTMDGLTKHEQNIHTSKGFILAGCAGVIASTPFLTIFIVRHCRYLRDVRIAFKPATAMSICSTWPITIKEVLH